MFNRIREDYQTHGRRLSERALWAMVHYRFGRWSRRLRFEPLRWVMGKLYGTLAVVMPIISGVQIDRRMVVGRRFHIIHAGMVALHPAATFGHDCGVMHNVTVGTNMTGGAPTIGNDVFIGCGAVILGEITIGDGVRIAANSLVLSDVPAGAMAMGVPAKIYPGRGHGKAAGDAQRVMNARFNLNNAESDPNQTAGASPTIANAFSGTIFRGPPSGNDVRASS